MTGKQESGKQKNNAKDESPESPGDKVVPTVCAGEPASIVNQNESVEDERGTNEEGEPVTPSPRNKERNYLGWLNFVLVVLAILVYGWQGCNMSRQAASLQAQTSSLYETVELTRNDQRAWVGVEKIDGHSNDALDLAVTVYTRNFGKSPALHFEQKLSSRFLPRDEAFAPDYRDAEPESIGTLFPGGQQIGFFPSHTWKPEEVKALESGASILYRYGEITYEDV